MSKFASAPRCTPPMPPVAKTSIPARCAAIIVVATVAAPDPPEARQAARSRRESLAIPRLSGAASRSSAASSSPIRSRPSRTAMVAGTAPPSRTVASTCRAVSMFRG